MSFPNLAGLVSILLLGGLVGCNLPAVPFDQAATTSTPAQYETIAAMLTETAFVSSPSPLPSLISSAVTPSVQPEEVTQTVAPMPVDTATVQPSPTRLCDLASAGQPIDVTIPDDSRMQPGESFVKIWRLVNTGSCTWTRNYAVTWFSGDNLGLRKEETFNNEVSPGGSVDLAIDMVAPEKPGSYQSNWKLRSPSGNLFGIGPGGGAPFWVRIQVVAVDTATPTVIPPTHTPTPIVSSSGGATLQIGEGIDVDSGQVGTGADADFIFQGDQSQLTLIPANAAKATLFGVNAPSLNECQAANLSAQPILLGAELEGSYLCIQTSRGLPGSVQISGFDLQNLSLTLNFAVWSVP